MLTKGYLCIGLNIDPSFLKQTDQLEETIDMKRRIRKHDPRFEVNQNKVERQFGTDFVKIYLFLTN